jgi:RNase H-like domain found in reverse transcriptase
MIGACLTQKKQNQLIKIIAFYFRKIIILKFNYNIYNKKLLIIIKALKK